ncbi:unnamed protein product [Parascedosporium putredinis]|uniref:C2 NT-type domain-containing protein n=1 Tax=Parascedosporium putredinis TaxID=1442378 RepID=A0A9P1M7N7_9PEZI|nr:unnamed protein product [Parascedosporium putredinis]CAI7987883.1 unnamed protein product [Parascedosporium putredinis]
MEALKRKIHPPKLTKRSNQPKFELHLKHRGRTQKCPIANHRVDYNYGKFVPSVRISIDRNSSLSESFIEFEVLQEFPIGGATRDERIPLGMVSLPRVYGDDQVEEGIARRYLMQDSKINSTLKIGILMVQIDGERNYIAPPLKTAPVFGGIAGIMAGDQTEQDEPGQMAVTSKSRDAAEVQDLYRRALAASWCAQPDEHPADAVIENIFSGGDGWNLSSARPSTARPLPSYSTNRISPDDDLESSGSISEDEGQGGTLRPSDIRRAQRRFGHRKHALTLTSQRSSHTIRDERTAAPRTPVKEEESRRSRSGSLASLAPTLGSSDRGASPGMKRAKEISETEAREDLVAWRLGARTARI